MIHVVATITATRGRRDQLLQVFSRHLPNFLGEPGCIDIVLTIDAQDAGAIQASLGPDSFLAIERWSSVNSMRAHLKSEHSAAMAREATGLMAGSEIRVLQPYADGVEPAAVQRAAGCGEPA